MLDAEAPRKLRLTTFYTTSESEAWCESRARSDAVPVTGSIVASSTLASLSFRATPPSLTAARARRRPPVAQVVASSSVLEALQELVAPRKLYVGNIPWTITNDELSVRVAEHGTV
ncbi:hypothetical protein ABZP36_015052 [Zizania latifolia]